MNNKRKNITKDFTVVGEQEVKDQSVKSAPEALYTPMSFDTWWIQIQSKHKFKPELKESMRKHFTARGFINDSRKFDQGLRDFGYNT